MRWNTNNKHTIKFTLYAFLLLKELYKEAFKKKYFFLIELKMCGRKYEVCSMLFSIKISHSFKINEKFEYKSHENVFFSFFLLVRTGTLSMQKRKIIIITSHAFDDAFENES